MNITKFAWTLAFVGCVGMGFADTKTTYRDAQGRIQGTKK